MQSSEQVAALLQQLSGNDNAARKQAEATINELRKSNTRGLFDGFVGVVKAPAADDAAIQVQTLACVLLKKYFLDGRKEEAELEQITPEDVQALKAIFKEGLDMSQPKALLRRKAEVICKLHKADESYGEIVTQLQTLAGAPPSDDETVVKGKEFAMYMFELLSEYHLPQEQIVANSANFMTLFTESLKDTNVRIRVATLKAITSFLTSIDEEEEALKYASMMESLLDIVIEVLKTQEDQGQASLESLIELTQSYGTIWTGCIKKLLFVCSEVMKNSDFEWATRSSALEIISTLAEENAKLLRDNLDSLKGEFFPALTVMITDVQHADDIDEWANVPEEDIINKNDPASQAASVLESLAECLGEKTTVACCLQIIKECTENKEKWQYRQAGFVILGLISEVCEKTFKANLDETVKTSAAGLLDEHPRVRFNALMSTGLLMNVMSPDIQNKFHADLMNVLIKMMSDETYLKMKSQVVSCTCNFVKGLLPTDDEGTFEAASAEAKALLLQYYEPLVKQISALFELSIAQNYAPLQEETLALLSCLAEVLSAEFASQYNTFMPGLKQLLAATPFETDAQQSLRANCIQTIGCILESVKDKPEVCLADAKEVTQALIALFESGKLQDSDPQVLTIQNTLPQLAGCLKGEFKAFLPAVMKRLFEDAKKGLDFKIVDAAEAELEEADDDENKDIQKIALKIKGMEGAKTIQMNSTALENKINAVSIIRSIAQELKKDFFEFVDPTATLITTDLLNDQYSSQIRKQSAKLASTLLDCLDDSEQLKTLFHVFLTPMGLAIKKNLEKTEFRQIKWQVKELQRSFKQFYNYKGAFMSQEEVDGVIELLEKVLQGYKTEKKELQDVLEKEKAQLDEDEIEDFNDGIAKYDRVWTYVMEISGVLMRTSASMAEPKLRQFLLPLYAEAFQNFESSTEDERLNSLCFMCDLMEYGSEDLFNFLAPQAQIQLGKSLQQAEVGAAMAQTAIFALGVIAFRMAPGTFTILEDAVKAVDFIYKQPYEAAGPGKVSTAADNATCALGKFIYQHAATNGGVLTADIIEQGFLAKLPLISDTEEAQQVHLLFAKQIVAQNAALANHAESVKAAVQRIIAYATEKPEEEILNDEGKAAFEEVNKLLA